MFKKRLFYRRFFPAKTNECFDKVIRSQSFEKKKSGFTGKEAHRIIKPEACSISMQMKQHIM